MRVLTSKSATGDNSTGHHVFEVFEVWQFVQIVQTEMNEEVLRRAVHHRSSDNILVTLCHDQSLVEQRFYRRGGCDAANLEDLRYGDRLFVGDHCKRFESR